MIASSLCNATAKFSGEALEVGTMMEHKTNLCSVDESSLTSLTTKRHKTDFSISKGEVRDVGTLIKHRGNLCSIDESSLTSLTTKRHKAEFSVSSKERKDKLGERIVALQQLVSPYGKTDTASVLLEAMEYIQFLHEQVKVLSAPYLQSTPTVKLQELEPYSHSLRNRGLCLVPISCTAGVARSNGADIWAPVKTTSPKFEKNISPFN